MTMKRPILLTLLLIGIATGAQAQVAIIAHPSVPGNTIDAQTVVQIMMLTRTKWSDDEPIRVFTLKKGTATAEKFYAQFGLNPLVLNKQWLRVQLTGEGRAPAVVTEAEMANRVASTPGAIGFVDISHVTGNVKVLRQVAP
jgi:ABC-type phosphate transport system substrate-binding protein